MTTILLPLLVLSLLASSGYVHAFHSFAPTRGAAGPQLRHVACSPPQLRLLVSSRRTRLLHLADMSMDQPPTTGVEPTNNINVPIKVWRVVKATGKEFATGYLSGYIVSALWSLLRGHVIDWDRSVRWGTLIGPVSAIYGLFDSSGKWFFGVTPENVWLATLKSVVTGLYIGRDGGPRSMIQSAGLYGAMTYYITKQKADQLEQAALENGGTPPSTSDLLAKLMSPPPPMEVVVVPVAESEPVPVEPMARPSQELIPINTSSSSIFSSNQGVMMPPFGMPPAAPIEVPSSVAKKIYLIVKKTVLEFGSGYMGGYIAAAIFGLFRGGMDRARCGRWGLMIGPVSSIYGCIDMVAKMFFGATDTSVWNATIKSVAAGLYFGRNGGIVGMAKNAGLYGAMTYYMTKMRNDQQEQLELEQKIAQPRSALDVDFEVVINNDAKDADQVEQ